jgi:lactate dehydrogenase-like 2-hydroxyacid dehydrogenase
MNNNNLSLVLMTHLLPEDWIRSLERKCNLVIGPKDATEFSKDLTDYLPQAEGLLTLLTIPITDRLLEKAPKLKVVSNMAVGVDNIDLYACTSRGIPVGNTPGVLTEATADLTMAILLASARRLVEASQDAQKGLWTTWSPTGWLGADLHNATLGIIGMGKIGKAVAMRARGFGMKIIYTDQTDWSETWVQKVTLETVLEQADFISLHVPLTDQTYHLINTETIKMMKSNAIIVNASRGAVIDTQALYNALINGHIAGAALDVTDPEPLPPDHPLYLTSNCLIVPHIGSATKNTRRRMAELACQNLLAGLENKTLPHCANPEVYQK